MDRNRVRTFESGASKRRRAKEDEIKTNAEVSKMKKMDQYFKNITTTNQSNDDLETESSEVVDVPLETAEELNNNVVESDEIDSNIDITSSCPGGDDIGKWPCHIPDQMR